MITILDGGMGRELKRSGAPFRQPEWSALALIEAPDTVAGVHSAFRDAGAAVLTTNSYALVPFHLGDDRFARDGRALAALAGRLARETADAAPGGAVRVAGSLPPPFGSYRPDLFDHARAGAVLGTLVAGLSPHIDLWLGETISSLAEAWAVIAAVAGDPRPLWLSFTLADDPAAPPRLRSGEPVAAAARLAAEAGAAALLFNCSQPEAMAAGVEQAVATLAAAGVPIAVGVYANAFPPQAADAQANETLLPIRDDLDPAGYAGWARRWADAGATIIGGCCGIGPEHIAALRDAFGPGDVR